MKKEHFLLLYLYSDRIEENIRTIQKERSDQDGNPLWYPLMLEYLIHSPYGMQHGYKSFEDMISHFQNRQQLELRIIHELLPDCSLILPAKEWKLEDIAGILQ